MVFTILFGDNKKTNNTYTSSDQLKDAELDKQFIKLYNADSTDNCSYDYFKSLDTSQKQDIINKFTEIKEDDIVI